MGALIIDRTRRLVEAARLAAAAGITISVLPAVMIAVVLARPRAWRT